MPGARLYPDPPPLGMVGVNRVAVEPVEEIRDAVAILCREAAEAGGA